MDAREQAAAHLARLLIGLEPGDQAAVLLAALTEAREAGENDGLKAAQQIVARLADLYWNQGIPGGAAGLREAQKELAALKEKRNA